jgi:hypothetical protein
MTKEQENENVNFIKKHMKGISESKEKSKKFLIELGTHDKNGKLTIHYR